MGRREGRGYSCWWSAVHGEEGRGRGYSCWWSAVHGEEGREGIQLLVECSAWGGGKGGDTAAGGVQCMGRREGGGDTADGGVHGEEGRGRGYS